MAAVLSAGVTAISAASRIAWSVGEYCLTATLTLLRRLGDYDAMVRGGGWKPQGFRGRRCAAAGSGSSVLLHRPGLPHAAATLRTRTADPHPYLAADRAAELGGEPASLPDVMGSDIVSVHVLSLPATERMITAELLGRLPDGAILINSARAAAIDVPELLRRTRSGRIRAALEIFVPSRPDWTPRPWPIRTCC